MPLQQLGLHGGAFRGEPDVCRDGGREVFCIAQEQGA